MFPLKCDIVMWVTPRETSLGSRWEIFTLCLHAVALIYHLGRDVIRLVWPVKCPAGIRELLWWRHLATDRRHPIEVTSARGGGSVELSPSRLRDKISLKNCLFLLLLSSQSLCLGQIASVCIVVGGDASGGKRPTRELNDWGPLPVWLDKTFQRDCFHLFQHLTASFLQHAKKVCSREWRGIKRKDLLIPKTPG